MSFLSSWAWVVHEQLGSFTVAQPSHQGIGLSKFG